MKSDVGSLALLDINFSHGEERVFEMHLRLGPWMISFLLFLGHLALGTYHLCLRISALTFGDVCWIPPFIFNNDTPLLLQNKIRLVSPLKEIDFFKSKKIKNTWLPGTCRKCLGSNNYFGNF